MICLVFDKGTQHEFKLFQASGDISIVGLSRYPKDVFQQILRILAERDRNRRHRYGLCCNLIAALYNYELSMESQLG